MPPSKLELSTSLTLIVPAKRLTGVPPVPLSVKVEVVVVALIMGKSLTEVEVSVNVCAALIATPPFVVPPLSPSVALTVTTPL